MVGGMRSATGLFFRKNRIIPNFSAKTANNRQTLRPVVNLFSSNSLSILLGERGGLLAARYIGPEETGLPVYLQSL